MQPGIIFLDFNNTIDNTSGDLCPDKVQLLNQIVASGGHYIVLTTSWREFFSLEELQNLLAQAGLIPEARVIGTTPVLWSTLSEIPPGPGQFRWDEIQEWFRIFPGATQRNWVILDDACTGNPPEDHYIQVDQQHGLRSEDVHRAIAILQSNDSLITNSE